MSSRKGAAKERELVHRLQDLGCVAHRVPLSGAMKGYPEDVVVDVGDEQLRLELKWRKNGESFTSVIRWFDDLAGPGKALLLDDFLVCDETEFAWWVKLANDYITSTSKLDVVPKSVSPRKTLQDWIGPADALVLRRGGRRTYFVCIPLYTELSTEDTARNRLHRWARSHREA